MKTTHKVLTSLLALLAACLLHAADSRTIAHVIAIQEVKTDDPDGFAALIAKYNAVAKAKLGIDPYIKVFVTTFDGEKINAVYTVTAADSVAALTKNAAALQDDPALAGIRVNLQGIGKRGARVLFQGLRFDGTYKNGSVFTTTAVVSDEDGYLKALDQLRALFDSHGLQDAKINVNRVLAGRTNFTHRITIGFPSAERLAAMFDFVASDPQEAEWLTKAAKVRTVVSNATAREITK